MLENNKTITQIPPAEISLIPALYTDVLKFLVDSLCKLPNYSNRNTAEIVERQNELTTLPGYQDTSFRKRNVTK